MLVFTNSKPLKWEYGTLARRFHQNMNTILKTITTKTYQNSFALKKKEEKKRGQIKNKNKKHTHTQEEQEKNNPPNNYYTWL